MIETQPKVARDGKYTISETARRLGIARSTVQNKVKEMKMIARPAKSGRLYISGTEIIKYWQLN
ncbi:MAG: helix-turn-helix domain-containing protein [Bacteroidales bacterium]|nr:helix-turn-helix domain-containing protein [Bacteroidales bacterium]